MVEAWRTATGQDLFPAVQRARQVRAVRHLHAAPERQPLAEGERHLHHDADATRTPAPWAAWPARATTIRSASREEPSPTARAPATASTSWARCSGATDRCRAVNLAALPKTVHFQGQGEVVTRSGFGAQDTWVYLRSGPIYNGHQHDDQGNLLVDAYGGELLVENDGGDVHHETIYHNSIRVAGRTRSPTATTRSSTPRRWPARRYERGQVTAVQSTAQYTYVATDFSAAYPDAVVAAPKAGKVTREVVTILPDLVVVRDRVTAAGALDVNFHAWAGAGTIDGSGHGYTITRGSGRAFVNAVLPASATVTGTLQEATDLFTTSAAGSASAATDFVHVVSLAPSASGFTPVVTAVNTATDVGATVRDQQGTAVGRAVLQDWRRARRGDGRWRRRRRAGRADRTPHRPS